jgi:5-methylcytosine-specific restriction endonuclease McrA
MSKALKKKVWKRDFGDNLEGVCICDNVITKDTSECGHIQSHATGGTTVLDNLRYICADCNDRMGIKHMDDYIREIRGSLSI